MSTVPGRPAPFTASDGVTLFRRVYEPQGAVRGDLLLGHGIGENSSRYVQAAHAFAAAGWRTTTWDLRGHGRSGGPRGYVREFRRFHMDLAEQVTALKRGGGQVVVVSHSLGGLIAFGAVAEQLASPDFLVLSAPALEANIATWKRFAAPILSRILPMLRIPTGIGADTSAGQSLENLDPDAPGYLYAVTTRLGDEGFRAQKAARDVVARGGMFPVRTLVTQGELDALVRPEWTKPLANLGNVEYVTLKGFNHHPFATREFQIAVDLMVARINEATAR
ncbi:MAG: alpha/beta hydrolase [bacterium]|nr:alpha/beta hydrolase [Candidatus Aquidulcis sp.]